MFAYALDNFYESETKDIDQQIDEAYEDYLENFHEEDEEPMSRSEYEERYY